MNQMKLYGMAYEFQETMEKRVLESFIVDELMAHLIDTEWDHRHNRKLKRLIKQARFRYQTSFKQVDFSVILK